MAERQYNDQYPTPEHLADAMTKFVAELYPSKSIIIESGCGEGRFLHAARKYWPNAYIIGVDNHPEYQQVVEAAGFQFWCGDFLYFIQSVGPEWLQNTLVLGNPPYFKDLPQQFVDKTLERSPAGGTHVAYLLRQSFRNSLKRAKTFVNRNACRVMRQVIGRPKFTKVGQDYSEYCVYLYEAGYHGHALDWKDPLYWKPKHLALAG